MIYDIAIRNSLRYDHVSGKIYWTISHSNGIMTGDEAGSMNSRGYKQIWINGKSYKAHRIAWFLYYGVWPQKNIDHINRIKDDNRIVNLRDVGQRENKLNSTIQNNNTSGCSGVKWNKTNKRWRVSYSIHEKRVNLGSYRCLGEAINARKNFERNNYGK